MNNKVRYLIVMILGVLMNQIFYTIAAIYHLPVWLDVCGTALVAFTLEPTAGLLVGLFNNFYLALFQYGNSTLIYYSISAMVALLAGLRIRVGGKVTGSRILQTFLLASLLSTLLSTLFAIWHTGGVPVVGWEVTSYQYFASLGFPKLCATFSAILFIRVLDYLSCIVIVTVFYQLLPRKLKFSSTHSVSRPISKA